MFIKDYLNFTDHYKVSLQELQKIFYDNNQTLKNLNDINKSVGNSYKMKNYMKDPESKIK